MQEVECNTDGCEETLRIDEYGRGEGILRGGALYCDMGCYNRHKSNEINRVLDEMRGE
jgi:hypothetical protein